MRSTPHSCPVTSVTPRNDDSGNCGLLALHCEPLSGEHEAGPHSTVLLIHKQVPPMGAVNGYIVTTVEKSVCKAEKLDEVARKCGEMG